MDEHAAQLIPALIEAKLIQFGAFYTDGVERPYLWQLNMLASYPDALRSAAFAVAGQIVSAEKLRLLCAPDAVPLGTAVALQTSVPLVIAHEVGQGIDLVGAYDIGHPAIFIANTPDDSDLHTRIIAHAHRVGLECNQRIVLLDTGAGEPMPIPTTAILTLREVAAALIEQDELPNTFLHA